MSTDDIAGYISDLTLSDHDNLCIISITALLLYDWALTLTSEQDLVWSRKMNVASVLYILARVSGPLYYLSTIALLGFVDDTTFVSKHIFPRRCLIRLRRCKALVYVQDVAAVLPYVVWAVFTTYRGYALSGRKGYVAGIILTLTLVPIGVNVYNFICTQAINYPPPTGCITNLSIPEKTLLIVILSEGIVIVWTWKCTGLRFFCVSKTGGSYTLSISPKSFREVLFENGSLFFLVLFLFNIVCLILTQVGPLGIRGGISYFRDAFTPLLVARFLLNLLALRRPADDTADTTDLFSTDIADGLSTYTASDVVESFVYPYHDGDGDVVRRSSESPHFV